MLSVHLLCHTSIDGAYDLSKNYLMFLYFFYYCEAGGAEGQSNKYFPNRINFNGSMTKHPVCIEPSQRDREKQNENKRDNE